MATTIEKQVALDEALVPNTKRLRIRRSNFRLPSDIQSKESTLQVVYDVLRQSPFFMAFLVTADIKTLTDVNVNKLYQPWRSFAAVINKCLTGKSSSIDSLRVDILFSTIKVVSRHQNTQQYGAILPIELTTKDIRNTKAYKEYYACATGEATPKPKVSARKKKCGSASSTTPSTPIATPTPTTTVVAAPRLSAAAKGKQPTRATSPTDRSDVERTEAKQLKIVLRRSRHETHISPQGGSGTDEGTSSKPGVSDVPSDDSDEEISWNSSDDEDVDAQEKVNDDDDDEEEIAKIDEQEATESGGEDEETKSDEESEEEETTGKEEESFDPIPKTPKESEDDGNGEEDQGLRISKEERMQEEDEADELYPSQPPIPPTPIPSDVLQTLLTFASVFRFEDRVKSLEVNFSELMWTNQTIEVVSNIPGLVHQYMHQEMTEAVREAVQIQTDRLQDSLQRENDEFLRTIDDNM
nr:hypothetical protein [Tanacetum cinerariifolium]